MYDSLLVEKDKLELENAKLRNEINEMKCLKQEYRMSIVISSVDIRKDLEFEKAYSNVVKFIDDCEVPLEVVEAICTPNEEGRYEFTLKLLLPIDMEFQIEMPSLSLEKIRYIGEENQNIWDFPRIYVDGIGWVWNYAIIKKIDVIGMMESNVDDYKRDIVICKEVINQLEN